MIVGWLAAVLAVLAGLLLAGVAAFGIINAASNGAGTSQIDSPLFVYGSR